MAIGDIVSQVLGFSIDFVGYILFTFFVSDKPRFSDEDHFNSSNGGGGGASSGSNNGTTNSDALDAAYSFFETTPKDATREYVKKKYKRLSLIHHPDRNGNSQDSVNAMQKVNLYHDLLQKELDRKEGVGDADTFDFDDDPKTNQEKENDKPWKATSKDPDEPGITKQERKRRRKVRHREERKAQEERDEQAAKARRREKDEERKARQEREKERRRMEKEWQEELEATQKRKRQFSRQRRKVSKESQRQYNSRGLYNQNGRDEAHDVWMSKVKAYQEHEKRRSAGNGEASSCEQNVEDIDETEDESSTPASESIPLLEDMEKPRNIIMDYCNDNIAVALRMGESMIAMEIFHEDIEECIRRWAEKKYLEMMRSGRQPTMETLSPDDSCREDLLAVLLRPLDDDGNNVFHYAVYFEDNEMISFLAHQARQFGKFVEFITKTNSRGESALQFAVCCNKDPTIPSRVQALFDQADEIVDSKKLGTRVKRLLTKLFAAVSTANCEPAIHTIFGLLLGRLVFERGWTVAILLLGISKVLLHGGQEKRFGKHMLFRVHFMWIFIKSIWRYGWAWLGWGFLPTFFTLSYCAGVPFASTLWVTAGSALVDLLLAPMRLITTPGSLRRYEGFIRTVLLTISVILLMKGWSYMFGSIVLLPDVEVTSNDDLQPSTTSPLERALAAFADVEQEFSADL